MSLEAAEEKYGMTVPDRDTMFELQRAEAGNPLEFDTWLDEGMPVDVMGDPHAIEAFRERQKERSPEVPTNIERQNNRSVQRSEDAARETGPAGESDVPDSVRDVISSSGQTLDADIQRAMENRMGDSLGDVQIHTGPQAASACESINARAFTVGNNIAFNRGEYDPSSPEGQHVLAHELAHVRQQTSGAVSMLPQEDMELEIDPDPALEQEAEETAQRVMSGGELGIQRLAETDIHVQRMPEADDLQQARADAAADSDEMTLRAEIDQIKERLTSVEQAVGDESMASSVGKAVTKGAVGAVGGLAGAAAGSMVAPGIGTIGGAAVGHEMAKGVAGDLTKTLTGQAYEKGTEQAGNAKAYIEDIVEEKIQELVGGSEHGGQDIPGIRD